ncbi:Uncharacterised protein [Streptococcus pneumoniae]|nr:Uncharacterised protein [Streptococcus pneumoniae]
MNRDYISNGQPAYYTKFQAISPHFYSYLTSIIIPFFFYYKVCELILEG